MFEVLNTPENKRSTLLDQDLQAFPYINGGLFAETIKTPDFNHVMRDALLKAMQLDWSKVSPAIFGSMFQGVMDEKQRRNLGAHYTSEANILKVIKPLFLDDLYDEFAKVKNRKTELTKFHDKLATLTFLDPACGCGNFLVITYRELRRLEHKVLDILYGKNTGLFELGEHGVVKCDVDQMYGIEIEDFPSLIAQTALWLTDHQMNNEYSKQTGQVYKRIPLAKHANIHHANALTLDWLEVIDPNKLNFILGNPPFVGSKMMSSPMRTALLALFPKIKGAGVLDYVTAWYVKSADFMNKNKLIKTALVSTNSITQGEQPAILWQYLYSKHMKIDFAHRTFKWSNDAGGKAAVYCIIIGFSHTSNKTEKLIFDYSDIKGDPIEANVSKINPYLVEANEVFIISRSKPICNVPVMMAGNVSYDSGYLIFTENEKAEFIQIEPLSEPWFKKLIGGKELINGGTRYCLWLKDIQPNELRKLNHVLLRVEKVKTARLSAKDVGTHKLAERSHQFRDLNNPNSYLALPKTSSENRAYLPMSMYDINYIPSDSVRIVPNATLYHFGILTSQMHMAWMRAVAGRLKSDYRYSKDIVYNNFIWPEATEQQKAEIEKLAQAILDARAQYPEASLADLYDPLTMPPGLMKAHKTLDQAVDKLYKKDGFKDDSERVTLLFSLYKNKTKGT